MKIAIVIDSIDNLTNGSVMTARRFADGLGARGHEVRIIAIGADGERDCAVKERYVPILTEVSRKNNTRFAKFDEGLVAQALSGVDLVHFIFPFLFEIKCKKLADRMHIPTTAAFHVQPENISYNAHIGSCRPFCKFVYRFFRKRFYRLFNRVHCPSAFIAEQLTLNGYKNELYVISNGYDPQFVPPPSPPENDKFAIIMVGRLTPEKNQAIIIDAIARSRYRENVRLCLLGKGERRKKLVKRAERAGVELEIAFLPKDELIKKLQTSDLYVHSSIVEIEAIACLEAIACGLVPVIANSTLSATPQFALDDRSLFESGNVRDLTERIEYWYENAGERRAAGEKYAQFARSFTLEQSIMKAEIMFADEIAAAKDRNA